MRLLRGDGDSKNNNSRPTRGKVVRPDFIQVVNDSGHWSKLQTVKNTVRPDVAYDNGWSSSSATAADTAGWQKVVASKSAIG